MTPERIDDESLEILIDMRQRTIEEHKGAGNTGLARVHELMLLALVELQEYRKTTQRPFMYGIADPDGAAHFGEFCVSSDAAHVEDEVHQLNEQCTEDGEPLYKVVPLYRLPELEK